MASPWAELNACSRERGVCQRWLTWLFPLARRSPGMNALRSTVRRSPDRPLFGIVHTAAKRTAPSWLSYLAWALADRLGSQLPHVLQVRMIRDVWL